MTDETLQEQVGIDREGVKIGSRFNPFLVLAVVVVVFVANAIKSPLPHLQLVNYDTLPSTGNHLFVVGREEVAGEDKLRFLVFDSSGKQRIKRTREEDIVQNAKEGRSRVKVETKLNNLRKKLKDQWEQQSVSEEDREGILREIAGLTKYGWTGTEYMASMFNSFATVIAHDIPLLLRAQLKLIWLLLLFSLVPGIMGMIYRRAFGTWFLASFVILYGINWAFDAIGIGSITAEIRENLQRPWTESFLLVLEMLSVVSVLTFRLSRHSAVTNARSRRLSIIAGVTLMLVAVGWVCGMWLWFGINWWQAGSVLILLLVGGRISWQSWFSPTDHGKQRKNIVVCLDGTWNEPGTKDFGYLADTNVFKLFKMLKHTPSSNRYNANRSKEYVDDKQPFRQIGFYYHGVGNKMENGELGQLFGGAFGMGASDIVERAYLDVVRVYRPGDRIFIFGFSRGAAIARLLAGAIGLRGVPESIWTLRLGRLWTVWKSSKKVRHTPDNVGDQQAKYRQEKNIAAEDVLVEVLGCWETVGAFGIAKNILGIPFQKINLLKNLTVSLCVKRAYHMLALDETRDTFEPTLMDPDPTAPNRIIEVWFSGIHSNVGGGYATDKLSDVTLDFLLKRVSSSYPTDVPQKPSWGLYLNPIDINPNPLGQIRQSTGAAYSYAPRRLPIHAVIHDSVFERMKKAVPVYTPASLFNLNQEFVEKRAAIDKEVMRLADTHTLESTECKSIRNWSNEKLSLMKWSKYLEWELDDETRLKDKLKPEEELANPAS